MKLSNLRHSIPTATWLAMLSGLAACAAWWQRFVMDDAFISFRYAANWAQGNGLVWNLGERVEGYSNFLWTGMLALAIRAGGEPIVVSQVLGVLFFTLSLIASHRLAATLLSSQRRALWAPALLASNYTYLQFATGGLETSAQAALVTTSFALACGFLYSPQPPSTAGLVGLGTLAACGVLLRLDSLLPMGLCVVASAACLTREPTFRLRFGGLAALLLPGLFSCGGWLLWKVGYYGELIPNTFFAAAAGVSMVDFGWQYLALFAREYFLFALLPLWLWGLVRATRRQDNGPLLLFLTVVAWCFYLLRVGGDFMEFRLLVPVLPLFVVSLLWALFELWPTRDASGQPQKLAWRLLRVALLLTLPTASLLHAGSVRESGTVLTIPSLVKQIDGSEADGAADRTAVGRALQHHFSDTTQPVVVAATSIGAIGYYSRLPIIDMHGHTDPWVARHGAISQPRPGRLRLAPMEYLRAREVNFVLAHPSFESPLQQAGPIPLAAVIGLLGPIVNPLAIPRSASLVSIPILDSEVNLLALYLTPTPEIDQILAQHGMTTYGIVFPQDDALNRGTSDAFEGNIGTTNDRPSSETPKNSG